MRKRFVSMVLLLMLTMLSLTAAAEEGILYSGDFEYRVLEDGSVEITNYSGSANDLNVPAEIDGKLVTSIGKYAFYRNDSLTNVTLPESLTSIKHDAFSDCGSLTSITLPDSLTSIDDYVFFSCDSLTNITLPDNLTSIGNRAFYDCNSLVNITLPDSLTSIGDYAFKSCSSLTSIFLPDNTIHIGANPFSNCSKLTSINVTPDHPVLEIIDGVLFNKEEKRLICYPCSLKESSYTVPQGIEYIGDSAFEMCKSLKSITLPEGVTTIGDSAFNLCYYLTSITLPEGVTSIGDNAFCGCNDLENITLPNSLTSIGRTAFLWCDSLTSITLPDGTIHFDGNPFYACEELTSISVSPNNPALEVIDDVLYCKADKSLICYPQTLMDPSYTVLQGTEYIAELAFGGCNSLISILLPESITSIGDYAFCYCSSLTSITLPEGVTEIGMYAFESCSSLTNVKLPKSLEYIGYNAFSQCPDITLIVEHDSYAAQYAEDRGIPYVYQDANDQSLPPVPSTAEEGKLFRSGKFEYRILEDGTAEITRYTGSDKELAVPAELGGKPVTSIGDSAFDTCYALTRVTLPDSVITIGDGAFLHCTALTGIDLSDNLTSIGNGAFSGCYSLTSIELPDSLTNVGKNPFRLCELLRHIQVSPENLALEVIDGVLFSKADKRLICYPCALRDEEYTVPQGIEIIGDMSFYYNEYLKKVNLPDSVIDIKSTSFYHCSKLKSFDVSANNPVFASIDGVLINTADAHLVRYPSACQDSEYTIPQGIQVIDDYAFSNCPTLNSINLPSGLSVIGNYAFFSCGSLSSISFPDSVTSVGDFAFSQCKSLTDLTLSESMNSIGESAFFNCESLTSITLPKSVEYIAPDAFNYCPYLVFTVECDSYAMEYADENGFPYVLKDTQD